MHEDESARDKVALVLGTSRDSHDARLQLRDDRDERRVDLEFTLYRVSEMQE
jgi:hypothetical protein